MSDRDKPRDSSVGLCEEQSRLASIEQRRDHGGDLDHVLDPVDTDALDLGVGQHDEQVQQTVAIEVNGQDCRRRAGEFQLDVAQLEGLALSSQRDG